MAVVAVEAVEAVVAVEVGGEELEGSKLSKS